MTPPPDLSEVPTPDLIAMLHLMLTRYRVRAHIEQRLAGLSREPIEEAGR